MLELANKMRGTMQWDENDESTAFHMTPLLAYFLTHYPETDFLAFPPFDAANSLHAVEPWAPRMEDQHPEVPLDIKATDGLQLVFRNSGGAVKDAVSNWRSLREHDKTQPMVTSASLKEVHRSRAAPVSATAPPRRRGCPFGCAS